MLLISTDPAHSLKDAFRQKFVPGKPTRVGEGDTYAGTLDVLEVDPIESLEEEVSYLLAYLDLLTWTCLLVLAY